jgi:hypothetical protein
MRKIALFSCLLGLIVLALPSFLAAQGKSEVIEKTFPMDISRPVSLEFHDVDGNLTFSPSGDNTIRVKIKKEVRSTSDRRAERLFRDTTVDFSQSGNSLVIRIRYPRWRGFFFWFGDFNRVKVTSEVFLPENSNLRVDLVDGDVRGSGFKGEMDLKTVDGDIRLSQIQGTIRAKTTDGDIDFKDIAGRVLADTVDGDVAIAGTFKELRLESTDGDIRVDCSPSSAMEKDWEIRTVDGDIELSLPSDFSADLSIQTRDGRIRTEIPVAVTKEISKKRLSAKLNNGGPLFSIRTGDGDISLRSR